jgi:hypothetical protein
MIILCFLTAEFCHPDCCNPGYFGAGFSLFSSPTLMNNELRVNRQLGNASGLLGIRNVGQTSAWQVPVAIGRYTWVRKRSHGLLRPAHDSMKSGFFVFSVLCFAGFIRFAGQNQKVRYSLILFGFNNNNIKLTA